MDTISEIFLHQIMIPGIDGDGITAPEAAAIRGDLATILDRPAIERLTDLPDVTDTPADGETIIWDADTETWVAGTAGGTIGRISNLGTTENAFDIGWISLRRGLRFVSGGAGVVNIEPVYGSSGTDDIIARRDHRHAIYADQEFRFGATGTLSSGRRTLVSGSVSGLLADREYMIRARLSFDLRGEGTGAGYTRPEITVVGNTRTRYGDVRTVAGVDRLGDASHTGVRISGVTNVAVSAAISYQSGDPIYIGAGALTVEIEADR